MKITRTFASASVLFALSASRVLAEGALPPPAPSGAPYALAHTSAGALVLEFGGVLAAFAVYSIAAGDPDKQCGWCESNAFDRSIRGALRVDNERAAATWSDIFTVGLTPAVGFAGVIAPALMHGKGSYALQDSVIILNSFILVTGLADGTKKFAARQRPAFHYGRAQETALDDSPHQQFQSFFSGHTAWAFTLATSATTLAYLRGYKVAPYLAWATGVLALSAGLLRIAADVHWGTDVLAGAVVGSATGFLMPFLLHGRSAGSGARVTLAPMFDLSPVRHAAPAGLTIALRFGPG